jgi:hypothetical protein
VNDLVLPNGDYVVITNERTFFLGLGVLVLTGSMLVVDGDGHMMSSSDVFSVDFV